MTLHQKTVRNNATFVTHLVRYCLMNHLENSLRPCTFIGNKLASPPPIKSYKSECQWNISTDTKGHIMSNIFLQVCQTSFYKWHCWSKNKMVCVGGGGSCFSGGGGGDYPTATPHCSCCYMYGCAQNQNMRFQPALKLFLPKTFIKLNIKGERGVYIHLLLALETMGLFCQNY